MNTTADKQQATGQPLLSVDQHNVAVLIKAALDNASELDGLRKTWAAAYPGDDGVQEEAERLLQVVERAYNACEALGAIIGGVAPEFYIRSEVMAIAWMMELRLRDKQADHGDGWKDKRPEELLPDAIAKMFQIEKSIRFHDGKDVARHGADLGNSCMFILNACGVLGDKP